MLANESLLAELPLLSQSEAQLFDPVVILKPDRIAIHDTARIDSFVKLEGGEGIYISAHVHIASFCHLNVGGGLLILDEGVVCSSGVRIITGTNVPAPARSCSSIAPGNVIERSVVRVGRNAAIFAGAIILPGVTIGPNAVVGAGSVVTRDVPRGEVWCGNPARFLRKL